MKSQRFIAGAVCSIVGMLWVLAKHSEYNNCKVT